MLFWPRTTIAVDTSPAAVRPPGPRTIDSFYGLHVTRDEYEAIKMASLYWESRVLEEGGSLFLTEDGLPPFDDLERSLAIASARGDTSAWLVLRDKMISSYGERAFALLERAAFRGAIGRLYKLNLELAV